MVTNVKAKPTNSFNVRVRFVGDDDNTKSLQYPAPYIEKLVVSDNNDLSELYPTTFHVGDVVDAFYQDGRVNGKWFRGRIANVSDDGRVCDVMYYDGDVSLFCSTQERIRAYIFVNALSGLNLIWVLPLLFIIHSMNPTFRRRNRRFDSFNDVMRVVDGSWESQRRFRGAVATILWRLGP